METPINKGHLEQSHSLGKGEVESSILSGSTRKPSEAMVFCFGAFAYPAATGRTPREHDATERGESVDFVHGPIREDSMEEPAPEFNSMKNKFETGLETLVAICHEAGLHPSDMVPALTFWAGWAKDNR